MRTHVRTIAAAVYALLALMGATGPATAHTGHDASFSLIEGAIHPLGGADHLAAMIAVGLWAAISGGRRVWVWPTAFVVSMLAGGILGRFGISLPMVEPAIAASVVVLGLLVATGMSFPVVPGALLIGSFAIFHGYAHALEAPASGWSGYATGFAISTLLLHMVGLVIGSALQRFAGAVPVRFVGAATAAVGLSLIVR